MKNIIIVGLIIVVLGLAYGYITPEEAQEKIEAGKEYIEEKIEAVENA